MGSSNPLGASAASRATARRLALKNLTRGGEGHRRDVIEVGHRHRIEDDVRREAPRLVDDHCVAYLVRVDEGEVEHVGTHAGGCEVLVQLVGEGLLGRQRKAEDAAAAGE
jgi:hypothetical protein